MNCNGKLLNLDEPVVMGILNVTPDSFYTKGRHNKPDELLNKATQMIGEGATILDIGGQSTRPRAEMITAEEEMNRVLPIIEAIHNRFPSTILSIDTFRSEVAKAAIQAGADIVNDISGGEFDPVMIETVIERNVPYICMHMQGTPANMQDHPHYNDVCLEVYEYFTEKIRLFEQRGLSNVILDVGFGFGKTIQHNYQLLNQLYLFQSLGKPILAGLSRKSMVYKPLSSSAEEALNGTTALNMVALQHGAKILRVHDVKEAKEVVNLYKFLHGN